MALKRSTAINPNGVALNIDATTNNFSMQNNGGTCYAYRLVITDTDNVTQYETSPTLLGTVIYDTEELSIDLNISTLTEGQTYLWYTDLYNNTSTVTITIASPGVVTWTSHNLSDGDRVIFTTTGALPTGLSVDTYYYIINSTTDTFQLALTSGGSAINTSGSQSGVHTAYANFITNQSYVFYSDSVPTLEYYPTPSGSSPSMYYDVEGAIFEVRGLYTQAQDIPVKSWYFKRYDSVQNLLETYTTQYNQNIIQEFTGLIKNNSYWIDYTIETENGYIDSSEKIKLIVAYDNVSATIDLVATNNYYTSGILIQWGGFVYILGVATGTAPNYVADFTQTGDYGLDPQSDVEVESFSVDNTFTCHYVWGNQNTSIDGDIIILENTTSGETLTVNYNNSAGEMRLYYGATVIDTVSFSAPKSTTDKWIIVVRSQTSLATAELFVKDGV